MTERDYGRIEAKIRAKVDMTHAKPADWIYEVLAVLEAESAQPEQGAKLVSKFDSQKQIAETLAQALFSSGAIELAQREKAAMVLNANLWGLVELSGVLSPRQPEQDEYYENLAGDVDDLFSAAETDKEKVLKVYPRAREAECIWDGDPFYSRVHLGCSWTDAASRLPAQPDSAAKVELPDPDVTREDYDDRGTFADLPSYRAVTRSRERQLLAALTQLQAAREEIARLKGLVR